MTSLVLVSLNLRLAVAAVSPVLTEIQSDLGLSSAVGGLLTTLPVLCFGAFAFLTPPLLRRFGLEVVIWSTMVILVGAVVLRLVPSTAVLFAATAVAGAAIAVANTALPSLIKRDFADRLGVVTGIYSMCLSGSAAIAAGLTVPVMNAAHIGWRPGITVWAVPAVLAGVVWAGQVRGARPLPTAARPVGTPAEPVATAAEPVGTVARPVRTAARPVGTAAEPGRTGRDRALHTDRLAWMVTGFMGLQSLGFYATLAWVPTLLRDHGMAAAPAGAMISLASVTSVAGSLAAPALARRLRLTWLPVAVCVVLCAVGYLGLIADPARLAPLWMVVMGAGQGAALGLSLAYIVQRAPDTHHAARLSTMAQGCGYLLASTGPFLVGAIHDATGGWAVPMLLLLALLVPELFAGFGACREGHVLAPAGAGEQFDE